MASYQKPQLAAAHAEMRQFLIALNNLGDNGELPKQTVQ